VRVTSYREEGTAVQVVVSFMDRLVMTLNFCRRHQFGFVGVVDTSVSNNTSQD